MKKKIKALAAARDGWWASFLEQQSERMRTPDVVIVHGVPQEIHDKLISSLVQTNEIHDNLISCLVQANDIVYAVHLSRIANLELKVKMLAAQLADAQQNKPETCGA